MEERLNSGQGLSSQRKTGEKMAMIGLSSETGTNTFSRGQVVVLSAWFGLKERSGILLSDTIPGI